MENHHWVSQQVAFFFLLLQNIIASFIYITIFSAGLSSQGEERYFIIPAFTAPHPEPDALKKLSR